MMFYELSWILKWDYRFMDDDDHAWDFVPQLERRLFIHCQLSRINMLLSPIKPLNHHQRLKKVKSLIESSPSCSKKDLKEKVLKILELDGLDDEEIRSEDTSSQHNIDEDYGDDNENDCYGICPLIHLKK
ncbi:S ribonuclease [Pyrus ussuriensis x Pyrus communis]|uniref:S ribonuclease n=1 Tax=Pyrus ussuriensis x Pyrus communis TaxID=2448454 RepID=A0A5N5FBY7_9ROSA|nr:S ribonuclease [Pyrus ussuriensis x Pyrus communis]